MGILQDAEKLDAGTVWHDLVKSWEGSSVGNAIDNAAAAAWAELKTAGPSDLLSITENVGTSILTGLAANDATSAIISNGITIAENAFKTAGAKLASTTLSTFVSAIHNQVVSTAPTAAAPASTAAPEDSTPAAS
jgi:hypothetical protein